jgi:hypothetical protein
MPRTRVTFSSLAGESRSPVALCVRLRADRAPSFLSPASSSMRPRPACRPGRPKPSPGATTSPSRCVPRPASGPCRRASGLTELSIITPSFVAARLLRPAVDPQLPARQRRPGCPDRRQWARICAQGPQRGRLRQQHHRRSSRVGPCLERLAPDDGPRADLVLDCRPPLAVPAVALNPLASLGIASSRASYPMSCLLSIKQPSSVASQTDQVEGVSSCVRREPAGSRRPAESHQAQQQASRWPQASISRRRGQGGDPPLLPPPTPACPSAPPSASDPQKLRIQLHPLAQSGSLPNFDLRPDADPR